MSTLAGVEEDPNGNSLRPKVTTVLLSRHFEMCVATLIGTCWVSNGSINDKKPFWAGVSLSDVFQTVPSLTTETSMAVSLGSRSRSSDALFFDDHGP